MLLAQDQITWHYKGTGHRLGRTAEGADVRQDVETGKIERIYSLRQRDDALKLAAECGQSEAARRLGIPRATVQSWVGVAGDSLHPWDSFPL
jgi:hypothetical protein